MTTRKWPEQPRFVTGHGLMHEGRPYEGDGRESRAGSGHAKCSCGELSPDSFTTAAARKRWHKRHKADVLAAWEDA